MTWYRLLRDFAEGFLPPSEFKKLTLPQLYAFTRDKESLGGPKEKKPGK